MQHVTSARRTDRLFRYSVAAVAVWMGIACAPVPAVAWADSPVSESTSDTNAKAGPAERADKPTTHDKAESDDDAPATDDPDRTSDTSDTEVDEAPDAAEEPGIAEPVGAENDSSPNQDPTSESEEEPARGKLSAYRPVAKPAAAQENNATLTRPVEPVRVKVPSAQTSTTAPAPAPAAVVTPSTPAITTPRPPEPLSPIAELVELPGRLVNAVLQALDLTSAVNAPSSPINLDPINHLLFGTFRELERLIGLHRTPPVQPVVPTLTYTGPTTRPTPTVAQFLNASAAGYVLGSTPGGLVPFTVDGFQMSATNNFTGMVGDVWATPEGQLIIAYQGTTGGTHLLFNPLITVSQIVADLQVVFTGSTPLAFYDALDFAERVQAEAALQGYSSDDIFVTGHSLGGWEAQFVAQQTGLAGIGFEAPGINTIVPGNGADSMFVNIGTYGSSAAFLATDLPGLQPFMPPYVPGGGSKPHYGPIVMIGDPAAMTPLYNASTLWGAGPIGTVIFLVDFLGNFFQYHLPGVQAYHLDVTPDPGVVLFLGTAQGPVHTGYGTLTIPQLMQAASDDGILFRP